jgi:hypothetical protein
MKSNKEILAVTSATRQVRQQWFSVCIFPLRLHFGLTGNRPQSAPEFSFLRYQLVMKTPETKYVTIISPKY